MLIEHERTSSNQIVVAIFSSLRGESLEDYSIRLAQAWRIGQKGLDNGVIFLVFLEDRRMRLEVGYGLEPTLTDALAASIIRDVAAPRFREGRLADGIAAGLDAIAQVLAGTYQRPPDRPAHGRAPPAPVLFFIVFGLLALVPLAGFIFAVRRGHQSRRPGYTGTRHGWGVTGPIGGGWWGGRSWSSGRGSSGSGFSGGGGSFGGGGASGSW